MPMLSPRVWALHAPEYATPCETASEAVEKVREKHTVVLADYQSAIRTLIMLGATVEEATHLANVAREQPQYQDSYTAE